MIETPNSAQSSVLADAFKADGAVFLKGAFTNWIEVLQEGVEQNRNQPGPYFAENVARSGEGSFWDDYCNWQRIEPFRQFLTDSDAGQWAAELMGSSCARLFHDHVLVKEPGTAKATPWHQDAPYYFVEGEQTISLWLPLDPVSKDNTLELIAGSHRWPKLVKPVKWLDDADFYNNTDEYMELPDIDLNREKFRILAWEMEPGDAVAFHYRTVHGAGGNTLNQRRRAFSMRWVGDDAHYVDRPGKTSPPFPGHDMQPGQSLREDWFPVLYRDS